MRQPRSSGLPGGGVEHEAVEAPEKGGQGFAGAGGGQDQGAFAARDDRPAEALRSGGRIKDGLEPLRGDGMEAGEGIECGVGIGEARGHAAFENSASGGEEEAKEDGQLQSRALEGIFGGSAESMNHRESRLRLWHLQKLHMARTLGSDRALLGFRAGDKSMREHLATLLDDFRRFDRGIAVVQLPRSPAAGHHLWRDRAAGRSLCGAAVRARHWSRRPRGAVGERTARSGLPRSTDACCAGCWRFRWTRMGARILRRGWRRMCGRSWRWAMRCLLSAACQGAVAARWPLRIGRRPFRRRSWPGGGSFAGDAAADSLYFRDDGRPQGHCAHPWKRAGQRGADRGRERSPTCATRSSSIRCAFCTRCR